MGLVSKLTGGGKQSHTVAMEIRGPEEHLDESTAQALLMAALAPLGEPHRSQIDNIELHLSPGREMFVAIKTTKISDVEKAEFEARVAECLQQIGPRLR